MIEWHIYQFCFSVYVSVWLKSWICEGVGQRFWAVLLWRFGTSSRNEALIPPIRIKLIHWLILQTAETHPETRFFQNLLTSCPRLFLFLHIWMIPQNNCLVEQRCAIMFLSDYIYFLSPVTINRDIFSDLHWRRDLSQNAINTWVGSFDLDQ